jgi:hypothetical protein
MPEIVVVVIAVFLSPSRALSLPVCGEKDCGDGE